MTYWEILIHFFRLLADWFLLVLVLRFYLEWIRAPYQHPLVRFCIQLTSFLVSPIEKLIPLNGSYINHSLILAWLVAFVANLAILVINPLLSYNFAALITWIGLILLSFVDLLRQSATLLVVAIVVQSLLTWLRPFSPFTPLLNQITAPFLRPFQFLRIGNVYVGALVLLLLVQLVVIPILSFLALQLVRWLPLAL